MAYQVSSINGSYAVDLQLRLLLQRGIAASYVALVIIAAVLSSFRLYRASSGFHIGIRPPLVLSLSLGIWRVNQKGASQKLSKEIMTQGTEAMPFRDCTEGGAGWEGGGLWGEVGGSCIALVLPGGCAGGGSPLPLLLLALTPGE
jgi:hypothetical protein